MVWRHIGVLVFNFFFVCRVVSSILGQTPYLIDDMEMDDDDDDGDDDDDDDDS
ncbi:hypothetical protein Gotur_003473 [Gossypium turneri]